MIRKEANVDIATIIEGIKDYIIFADVLACLIIGYVIKHSKMFKTIANDNIPLILVLCGVIIVIAIKWGGITPIVIISGACSGLIAVGLHQAFSRFIDGLSGSSKEENNDN